MTVVPNDEEQGLFVLVDYANKKSMVMNEVTEMIKKGDKKPGKIREKTFQIQGSIGCPCHRKSI